jgi:tetratricopeptide (TPR) repeat protein
VRGLLAAVLFLFGLTSAGAQTPSPQSSAPFAFAHFRVSTTNPEAQAAFDDGLTLLYAFNPEEARRRFERATTLDPSLAMAHWGVALSWGVNINTGFDPAAQHHGRQAIDAALALTKTASPPERALIAAAFKRYGFERKSDAERSARAYSTEMNLVATAFPENDDVQAIAAEAAMDIRPWGYWSGEKPEAGTLDIVERLNAVLARNPQHIQANHLLIHILEESPHPERALDAANRLAALRLEPAAEHLTHMSAHITMQTGDYHAAGNSNARALDMFDAYLAGDHATGHESYAGHDCKFAVEAYMLSGEAANALRSARRCGASAFVMEGYVSIRFRRWTDLANGSGNSPIARALLAAHAGKLAQAEADAHTFDIMGSDIAKISAALVRAEAAAATGDRAGEIAALEKSVALEDQLGYGEPPQYFFPIRESLGGAYFRAGKFSEAERVFRADLAKNPLNPRSLFGLAETLQREDRSEQAGEVRKQFATAWRYADTTLDMKDL